MLIHITTAPTDPAAIIASYTVNGGALRSLLRENDLASRASESAAERDSSRFISEMAYSDRFAAGWARNLPPRAFRALSISSEERKMSGRRAMTSIASDASEYALVPMAGAMSLPSEEARSTVSVEPVNMMAAEKSDMKESASSSESTASDEEIQAECDLKPFVTSEEIQNMNMGEYETTYAEFMVSQEQLEEEKVETVKNNVTTEFIEAAFQ